MPQGKIKSTLQKLTEVIFVLIFSSIIVRLLLVGAEYINDMPAEPNNMLAFGIGVIWLCAIFLFNYSIKKFKNTKFSAFFLRNSSVAIAFIILFVIQALIAVYCCTPSGWDPQVLITTANDLLKTQGTQPYDGTYFHQNPNNVFLLGIFRYFFAFLNQFGITNYLPFAAIGSAFCVNISVLFLFILIRKFFGVTIAWVGFMLSAPAIALSPWIVVPYSDTYGMPFAIWCILIYCVSRVYKNIFINSLGFFFCAMVMTIGSAIKPTVLLLIPAIIIVEFICAIKNKTKANNEKAIPAMAVITEDEVEIKEKTLFKNVTRRKKPVNFKNKARTVLIFVTCFLLGMSLASFMCNAFDNKAVGNMLDPVRVKEEAFSLTHYLMMGLSQPHGSYAYEDMQLTESVKGSAEKTKMNLQETKKRFDDMGPINYAKFLWRKLNYSWNDGTFFFGREGAFYNGTPPQQGNVAKTIQSVYRADGAYYQYFALWQQAQWLMLMLLMVVGVFYTKGEHTKYLWFARICVLGLVCFLLIFEARSRYVYHFLPVLYFAAIGGILKIEQILNNVDFKKFKRNYFKIKKKG